MDLTRSLTNKLVNDTENETPRKLAFSVENILDPNKFTGKKVESFHNNTIWSNISQRNLRENIDDDHSESQSGELIFIIKKYFFFKPEVWKIISNVIHFSTT